MDIYKDLIKNDENLEDVKKNQLKSKFYFPLIGSDPILQKQIIEDDNNSIKIKLKKIRKFRNKSLNFEQLSLMKGNLDKKRIKF